jgi:hypothetical protein
MKNAERHVWIYDILHSEIKFRAQYGFERFFSHTCYVTKIFCCMLPMLAYSCVLFQHFLNHRCKLYIYRRVVSKSGNPGPNSYFLYYIFVSRISYIHTCEPSGGSNFLPILKVPSVPPVNFQNLPPVKKIKYKKILTHILRSIFLEIPHLELPRWWKTPRDTNGKGKSHLNYKETNRTYIIFYMPFGKENYLTFDWWKHFLKTLRRSEVTINLARRLKKMEASEFAFPIWNSRADEKRREIRMVKVKVIFNDIRLLICLTPLQVNWVMVIS